MWRLGSARTYVCCSVLVAVSGACGSVTWPNDVAEDAPAVVATASSTSTPAVSAADCVHVADQGTTDETLRACEAICDRGDGRTCEAIAERLDSAGADAAAALALYDKSCGLGRTSACSTASERRAKSRTDACAKGTPQACAAAVRDADARCDARETGACDAAERLDKVVLDRFCITASVETCRGACDAHLPLACAELGTLLINGDRVPADGPAGVKLLEGACDDGEIAACGALGDLYAPFCPPKYTCLGTPTKRVVPESPEKALGYYMRGCAKGIRSQCDEVLELQDGGSLAVPREPLLLALRLACSNGKKEACGRIRDMGEEP